MFVYSSRVFLFLWATALVFSGLGAYYGSESLATSWTALVTVGVGLVLLARPTSLVALRLSVWGFIAAFVAQMPANPNHRWVLFLIAVAVLVRFRAIMKSEEVAEQIQGSLRWVTVIVYLFAALAKLNTAYFDPTVSCATLFSLQTFFLYGLANVEGGANSAALSSTLIEGMLPVLLIWSRTRKAAIAIGILFHIGLSLNIVRYFGNFSAAMFVLLASWLPEDACRRMCTAVTSYCRPALRVWGVAIGVLTVLALTTGVPQLEFAIARQVLFLLFAVSFMVFVIPGLYRAHCQVRVGHPSFVVVALAVINASMPYIGIKTRASLTMYSNLRIEPDYSNHFFMPASPDPFGYLRDTAEILEASDPRLQERLSLGASNLPYLGLCAYLACQDDLCTSSRPIDSVTYRHKDRTMQHRKGAPLPADCPPWIVRKTLFVGPAGPHSERVCTW